MDREPGDRALPLLAWKGTLVRDRSVVVIAPVLWESDNNSEHARPAYTAALTDQIRSQNPKMLRRGPSEGWIPQGEHLKWLVNKTVETQADRPIGTCINYGEDRACDRGYSIHLLTLDYDTAEEIITGSRGLVKMEVNDMDRGSSTGRYTLYLRVERVK
jgi:hypothetical protein